MIANAYSSIDIINWNSDAIIMHYEPHVPHPSIADFLISKQGPPGSKPNACYPCDQYVMSRSDALSLQLGYIFFKKQGQTNTELND